MTPSSTCSISRNRRLLGPRNSIQAQTFSLRGLVWLSNKTARQRALSYMHHLVALIICMCRHTTLAVEILRAQGRVIGYPAHGCAMHAPPDPCGRGPVRKRKVIQISQAAHKKQGCAVPAASARSIMMRISTCRTPPSTASQTVRRISGIIKPIRPAMRCAFGSMRCVSVLRSYRCADGGALGRTRQRGRTPAARLSGSSAFPAVEQPRPDGVSAHATFHGAPHARGAIGRSKSVPFLLAVPGTDLVPTCACRGGTACLAVRASHVLRQGRRAKFPARSGFPHLCTWALSSSWITIGLRKPLRRFSEPQVSLEPLISRRCLTAYASPSVLYSR